MALSLVITNAGRAALVAAANAGTNAVTIAQVGVSGAATSPTPATTTLPGEVKRIGTISGSAVAADTIHMIVRDESADVFSVRSIALYLADGTLFAAYGQAGVIVEKSAQALLLLAIDVRFVDVPAASLTFGNANFLNPPATTATPGVVELATDAEAEAGTDPTRALTPANVAAILSAAKILQRLLTVDGSGSGLDADLLDGQDGAWYANIAARLGFTPANRAGDTFTGAVGVQSSVAAAVFNLLAGTKSAEVALDLAGNLALRAHTSGGIFLDAFNGVVTVRNLGAGGATVGQLAAGGFTRGGSQVWDAGNDGAGSGLDADLLDGQDGAYYANVLARLGFTPANRAGDTFTGAITAQAGLAVTGAHTRGGSQVWDAGNDGAGSGLDADLLDGQDGAWYAAIAARLGYTPANRAGEAFTGGITAPTIGAGSAGGGNGRVTLSIGSGTHVGYLEWITAAGVRRGYAGYGVAGSPIPFVSEDGNGFAFQGGALQAQAGLAITGAHTRGGSQVWDAGNDGAGSGLDADLLDGQDGAFYAAIAARLGYTPANRAGDTFTGAVAAQAGLAITGAHTRGGSQVWDAGNDGSGSGLDADLLDGFHASAFNRVTAASLAQNGYRVHADGFKECWGTTLLPGNGTLTVTLPTPHTAWLIPIVSGVPLPGSGDGVSMAAIYGVEGDPPTGFQVRNLGPNPLVFYWQSRGV